MHRVLAVLLAILLVPGFALAQTGIKKRRPLPYEYGRVRIGSATTAQKLPDATFDHWVHRAKFTCRVCHVDLGFAMKPGGTGIRVEDIVAGYYCGSCHNGKTAHGDRVVFAACSLAPTPEEKEDRCWRCHGGGQGKKRLYDFAAFVADLPKERFGNGVNWELAESTGQLKPVDYVEGASFKRKALEIPKDIDIEAKMGGMNEIIFSHKKHTFWNGCEGCHPEIFAGIKKGTTQYSMVEIFAGKYCGQCHTNVAFPMIDCQRCHTKPVQ
jgi:c(7)-type cytochrome triheme protein